MGVFFMNFFEMKWRLSACRVQNGYTQKEASDILGICEKTLISWESGKTAPNMEFAQKLSELYCIPLAYIDFSRDGNRCGLKDRVKEKGVTL
jgi:DNA-binding XRE family transcriptional regulator